MGQDSFVYSCVARGTTTVAEYAAVTGNFPAVATRCLQRFPFSDTKFSYYRDHHIFYFLVRDGYAYCVVAKESVENELSFAFLENIKAYFKERYGVGTEVDTAAPKSLDNEFGPIMKEHMQYIVDHAEEIRNLAKAKAQVSQVKNPVLDILLEKAMDGKGCKMWDGKAQVFGSVEELKKAGMRIRRKMWYDKMKRKLVVIGILLLLAFLIWLSICHIWFQLHRVD